MQASGKDVYICVVKLVLHLHTWSMILTKLVYSLLKSGESYRSVSLEQSSTLLLNVMSDCLCSVLFTGNAFGFMRP